MKQKMKILSYGFLLSLNMSYITIGADFAWMRLDKKRTPMVPSTVYFDKEQIKISEIKKDQKQELTKNRNLILRELQDLKAESDKIVSVTRELRKEHDVSKYLEKDRAFVTCWKTILDFESYLKLFNSPASESNVKDFCYDPLLDSRANQPTRKDVEANIKQIREKHGYPDANLWKTLPNSLYKRS